LECLRGVGNELLLSSDPYIAMIDIYVFTYLSVILYIVVFWIMSKLPFPFIVKVFIVAPTIGSTYLNISDYGVWVQKLNIEPSPELRWVSATFLFIYIISMTFFFGEKK